MPSADTTHRTPKPPAPKKRSGEPGAAVAALVIALGILITAAWVYAVVVLVRWLII
jgi:hypothetical protein